MQTDWWERPRAVSVVVDNPGWGRAWGLSLVDRLVAAGERAQFCDYQEDVQCGGIAVFLNCLRLTKPDILARNHRNLVVHASDLPKGRGFSPWTWMILDGAESIPVCLIEAAEAADEGDLIYKDWIHLDGHELIDEIREQIGIKTIELCERFLAELAPPIGKQQQGEASWYQRRYPEDSRIDIEKPLGKQFNLLRIVDNHNYPAFFDYRGKRYILRIEKSE